MEYKCKYCGNKVAKYQTICVTCYAKLKQVRELLKLVNDIKAKASNLILVDGKYHCPRCNSAITIGETFPNYCSECGYHITKR